MAIHPTAIVDKTAEVHPSAEIGAYAIVEGGARLGPEVRLYPHAFVGAYTILGARCVVHSFAVVGHIPQDLKFRGDESYTEIGEETVIREHATVHRGTEQGSRTVVGRRCLIMSTAHVGHSCELGDHVILANGALVSGHITVGDRAFISGNSVVHQFCRIGELVMVAGLVRVPQDVPPFMLLAPAGVACPNVVGLRRAGFTSEERLEIRKAHRLLYRSGLHFPQAVERIAGLVRTTPGRRLLEFLRQPSKRGYMTYRGRNVAPPDDGES
ncbi:MAG: acyl-ACP--UDP-N-acetylglucosamine O-acyltransferase [Planctomycetota bacterium]